jgi:hypothetical protein
MTRHSFATFVPWAHAGLAIGALAIATWAVVTTGHALAPFELAKPKLLSPPPLVEMDPRVIDILTMGHRGLYDDFINIWAIQILMDEAVLKESPDDVADAIRRVTRQGPKLESLYMLSCFVMAMDFRRPDLCLPFTMDGLAAFPESWKIPLTQGAIMAFRMDKRAEAAPFFHLASIRPKAPPFLASFSRKLQQQANVSSDDVDKGLEFLDLLPGGQRLKQSILDDNARRGSTP